MDLAALKDYILADPELANLAGPETDESMPGVPYPLSKDQTIVEAMHSLTVDVVGEVTRARLIQWATATGQRRLIQQHASDMESPLAGIALTLRDILAGALDTVDFSDSANVGLLDVWLSGTVPDDTDRADSRAQLMGLATKQKLVWPDLNNLQVAWALGRIGLGVQP